MTDIAPELYADVLKDFEDRKSKDPEIASFMKKLEAGKATESDCMSYAGNLGECAVEALNAQITEEKLPDGKLYCNIAEKTVKPLLKEVHKLINEAAIQIQKRIDEKSGINMNPQKAPFPEERVNALLNGIVHAEEKSE